MFWTLGSEIPNALATWDPVLPALTNWPTLARMASVIVARLRDLGAVALLGRPGPFATAAGSLDCRHEVL